MCAPDPRRPCRRQAENPLIALSEFAQPPLPSISISRVSGRRCSSMCDERAGLALIACARRERSMKREDILKQISTPFGAPAFARGPRMFYDREYLNITYRTDADLLRKIVPEPLEIDEPLVRFEVMNMPDTMTHGAYIECGQAIAVRFGQERGEYLHAMYVDNHPAIASGREVNAYPKKLGSPNFYVDSDTLVGTLDYGALRVAIATMGYKYVALDLERAREEICVPTFMLKILPNYL